MTQAHASYEEFLASKAPRDVPTGITTAVAVHPRLFDFQAAIVRWALRRGRAAIFADTGLGKTLMQLEWARHVAAHTGGRVLILAPLAVTHATAREAATIDMTVLVVDEQSQVPAGPAVVITNYDKMHRFDLASFAGVVLDESSIIKAHDGKTREAIITGFAATPYRLACTATPSPNDHVELGNHAEFVGAMTRTEMLSTFFVHDGGDTSTWRLKGHARKDFWRWVCSWAVAIKHPRDIGFDQAGYDLPALHVHEEIVEAALVRADAGALFATEAKTLAEQRVERRATIDDRVARAAALVNATAATNEPWIVWCDMNAESEALTRAIAGAVEVTGSDTAEHKERTAMDFAAGKVRVIVSKPSIFGFGLNWQHCANMAFVGVSHSYEAFYQAIRRCWRFGQQREVHAHVITASTEGRVVANLKRKERDAQEMMREMVASMADISGQEVRGVTMMRDEYETETRTGEGWVMRRGDCVDVVKSLPNDCIGYTIFSPPFASLYTYSASDRDMGNCSDYDEFAQHFRYLVPELLRVTQPGRLLSFHCMLLPTSKTHDGEIGIRDFRGELIREFVAAGWVFHSEVVIWKDPVTAMQRTKALGLLHKQLKKDSCMSRQGIPDYLVTMRKPGVNAAPVTNTNETFPVQLWQEYASPVWMDINPSDTLQGKSAREHEDERHICPLQLEVIRRALKLWSRPGDVVLSPFAGIGSEGYCALQGDRAFVGAELKKSYFEQACANLARAKDTTPRLFEAAAQ